MGQCSNEASHYLAMSKGLGSARPSGFCHTCYEDPETLIKPLLAHGILVELPAPPGWPTRFERITEKV